MPRLALRPLVLIAVLALMAVIVDRRASCREKSEEISALRPVLAMIVAALVPVGLHG